MTQHPLAQSTTSVGDTTSVSFFPHHSTINRHGQHEKCIKRECIVTINFETSESEGCAKVVVQVALRTPVDFVQTLLHLSTKTYETQ